MSDRQYRVIESVRYDGTDQPAFEAGDIVTLDVGERENEDGTPQLDSDGEVFMASAERERVGYIMFNQLAEVGADGVDIVNHPPHYNFGTIEVIDAIEDWGLPYFLGNVVKYVARCDHKGKPVEDLRKARFYLDREIAKREAVAETA